MHVTHRMVCMDPPVKPRAPTPVVEEGPGFSLMSLLNRPGARNLSRVVGPGNRRKSSISIWLKTPPSMSGEAVYVGAGDSGNDAIYIDESGANIYFDTGSSGFVSTAGHWVPAGGTWYNIIYQWDTDQAVAADRVKILVDGVNQANDADARPPLNHDTSFGADTTTETFYQNIGSTAWLADELARFDGQHVGYTDVSDGGRPKDLTGLTFGSQGYWLGFETGLIATVGVDISGNGNDLTPSGDWDDGDFSTDVP